jgi:hypothetical protein
VFTPELIQDRLRQKPFRPLRIIASEGRQFDIHRPDLVMVGVRDLMVGFASPRRPAIYEQVTRVALAHIVAMEDLPAPPTPASGES